MSKSNKKKGPGSKAFSSAHGSEVSGEQNEKGMKVKNISAKRKDPVARPSGYYGAVDGADEYVFRGITPGKVYLHPPNRLISGRVIYRVKYYGYMNVKEPRGGAIVKDAIDKLSAVADVLRANNPDDDVKMVDLSFSIRGVSCFDVEKKLMLHQHPIHIISFFTDDKRRSNKMFAFIAKGSPPERNNVCFAFESRPKQAIELAVTLDQVFDLAYKKFFEGQQAHRDFAQLKKTYDTATPEEKEKIQAQMEEVTRQKAKEIAAAKAKARRTKVDPQYRPSDTNSAPVTVKESSSEPVKWIEEDKELSVHMAGIQKKAREMEIESELQRQQKDKPKVDEQVEDQSSVTAKWTNITVALEPFHVEPSLDPATQYLMPRPETSELNSVIEAFTQQIKDMEEAFAWHRKRKLGPVDETDHASTSSEPFTHPLFDSIDTTLKEIRATTDDLQDLDLPVNYVMDEFVKAREQASLPKSGTVKGAASGWYEDHRD